MRIHKTLFIIGLLILIMPFSGLPSNFEDIFNVIFGVFLVFMAISIKMQKVYKKHLEQDSVPDVIVATTGETIVDVNNKTEDNTEQKNVEQQTQN